MVEKLLSNFKNININFFAIVFVLFFAVFNVWFKFGPALGTLCFGDTNFYANATDVLFGGKIETDLTKNRLLKPMSLVVAKAISTVSHTDATDGIQATILLFYLFLGIAIYLFLAEFTNSHLVSALSSVFFISAYPLLEYGLNPQSETGAIFWCVLSAFFIYKFYLKPEQKYFWLSIITIIVGFLWKEYSAVAGVALGLVILFHRNLNWREKIKLMSVYGLFSILILGGWQFYVYHAFSYSYANWYSPPNVFAFKFYYDIAKSLFAIFLGGWLFVLIGLKRWHEIPKDKQYFLLLMFVSCLIMFAWNSVSSRLYFVIAIPSAVLLQLGMEKIKEKYGLVALMLIFTFIISLNYVWLLYADSSRALLTI